MKIIDFETKGNVVQFTLGEDDCFDYWGDDWNDYPYEHNAGLVYDKYVKGHATVMFPFNYTVLTPESDWSYGGNSPFSKEDFKELKAPCVIAVLERTDDYDLRYSKDGLREGAIKFYFEDKMEPGIYFYDSFIQPINTTFEKNKK